MSQLKKLGIQRLVVTSANPGEGKSTFTWQASRILAEANFRTLLVDGDLHNPTLTRQMALLQPDLPRWSLVQLDPKIPLFGFSPGPDTNDPDSAAQALQKLLTIPTIPTMLAEFDFVLFDSPPHLLKDDVFALGKLCQGALMVASAKHFKGADSLQLKVFEQAELPVVGAILTQDQPQKKSPLVRVLASLGLWA